MSKKVASAAPVPTAEPAPERLYAIHDHERGYVSRLTVTYGFVSALWRKRRFVQTRVAWTSDIARAQLGSREYLAGLANIVRHIEEMECAFAEPTLALIFMGRRGCHPTIVEVERVPAKTWRRVEATPA